MNRFPNASISAILPTFTPNETDASEDTSCRPYFYEAKYPGYYCAYVKNQTDICSGGGYLIWAEYVVCTESPGLRALVIIASIIFLFFMFFLMAIVADEFLSKNIEIIVEKLKISQNIAGVTLMAFANGAPDVFTAIASVVGADRPQADLALSGLLGAAIFDGSFVFALIVLIKPFAIMRRPIIRDIIFFLMGMGWLAVIFFHANQVFIWEPAVFLGLYLMYTFTVIFGRVLFVKKVGSRQLSWISSNMGAKHDSFIHGFKNLIAKYRKPSDANQTIAKTDSNNNQLAIVSSKIHPGGLVGMLSHDFQDQISESLSKTMVNNCLSTSMAILGKNDAKLPSFLTQEAADVKRKNGVNLESTHPKPKPKFSIATNLSESPSTISTDTAGSVIMKEPDNKVMITVHTPNMTKEELEGRVMREGGKFFVPEDADDEIPETNVELEDEETKKEDKNVENAQKRCCRRPDLRCCFRSIKIFFRMIRRPTVEILGLTIPLADQPWNRPLVVLKCFTAPLLFMFAFQCFGFSVQNGPPIWLLVLCGALVVASLLVCLTDSEKEPRFYQIIAAFVGFILSAIWIYELANEIVNVVMMLGVIINISNEILGVTIIAWANSIGDLIADTSVARKGFPRMGISACIGGPLYNVFFGFGISFIIAKAQNKYVSLNVSTSLKIMLIAHSTSLIVSLILIIVQRFRLKRFHGIILICLYVTFLVLVVLAELNVINF